MYIKRSQNARSEGSSLLAVILAFALLSILAAAVLTTSYITSKSTSSQINHQQAYFTARSAAQSVADYIQKNPSDDKINALIQGGVGMGTAPKLGTYHVSVAYTDSSKSVLKVASWVLDSGGVRLATVAAYLTKNSGQSGSSGQTNPFSNLIYVNGTGITGFSNAHLLGSGVMVDGDFTSGSGSSVACDVVANGSVHLSSNFSVGGSVSAAGGVTLDSGAKIANDVNACGDLTIGGGSSIGGNTHVDGNIVSNSGTFSRNVKCGNSITMNGGAPQIMGDLIAGGSIITQWGTPANFVKGMALSGQNVTPTGFKFTGASLAIPAVPSYSNTINLSDSSKSVSASGLLGSISGNYGNTYTFDTTSGPIDLVVKNKNLDLSRTGFVFKSTGPNNLYIYLTGNASLTLDANNIICMSDYSAPKIYVIGDGSGTQKVTLTSNSRLDGYVYMPQGSFYASGDGITYGGGNYKLWGTVIAKSIDIESSLTMLYSPPDFTSAIGRANPLASVAGQGTSTSGWVISKWWNG